MSNIPDKLFINLKILGKIQKNGRISRSSAGIISLENESFYQSIKRFVTSDSRKQSIFEINSIINETIESLHSIINSKYMNKNFCKTDEYYKNCENISLILDELKRAKVGVDNLKFTYTSDANVESQLDIIILKMASTIKDVQHKIDYFMSYLPETFKTPVKSTPSYFIDYNESTQPKLDPPMIPIEKSSYTTVSHQDNTEYHDHENIDDLNYYNDDNDDDEYNDFKAKLD
jgi:hypothetical protein